MLLIWDIHINSRIQDKLLSELRNYISQNSDQQNIVFLWDYVYHFAYDRWALLSLYQLFLDLYSQWKNVYVLAWNHDRLWNTFVFEEAKRTYQALVQTSNSSTNKWKIEFITSPKVEKIDGQDILFLPYFLDFDSFEYIDLNKITDTKYFEIIKIIQILYDSKKKNEQISAKLNHILLQYLNQYPQLTLIHHYYVEWVSFPWQKARFYFNDIAISKLFTEFLSLKMISGHLHQGFAYKNYFCTGSVWSTSSLEVNQTKLLFNYSNNTLIWNIIFTNPYFLLEQNSLNHDSFSIINEDLLSNHIQQTIQENKKNYLWSEIWNVQIADNYKLNKKDISLSIKVEKLDYEKIFEHIDSNLHSQLKDVKLKKTSVVWDVSQLSLDWKNFTDWFSDRKSLLKDYIKLKYPEDHEKYLEFLHEIELL